MATITNTEEYSDDENGGVSLQGYGQQAEHADIEQLIENFTQLEVDQDEKNTEKGPPADICTHRNRNMELVPAALGPCSRCRKYVTYGPSSRGKSKLTIVFRWQTKYVGRCTSCRELFCRHCFDEATKKFFRNRQAGSGRMRPGSNARKAERERRQNQILEG